MTDELGTLSSNGTTRSVRFVRAFDVSAGELWDAITDPKRIAPWMRTEEMLFEPHVGGKVRYRWGGNDESIGTVKVFEPPHAVEYTWKEGSESSTVRFELRSLAAGVELTLHHWNLSPDRAAGVGAGWHAHLEYLGAVLRDEAFDFDQRFNELLPGYTERAATL
jgi:uncharacterized protein YndB with AHSA1/START domain